MAPGLRFEAFQGNTGEMSAWARPGPAPSRERVTDGFQGGRWGGSASAGSDLTVQVGRRATRNPMIDPHPLSESGARVPRESRPSTPAHGRRWAVASKLALGGTQERSSARRASPAPRKSMRPA